ncbi:hypothetical protein D3C83_11040 [compost metagenome]
MAPHHAGGRARHVRENAIIRASVPPAARIAGVAANDTRRELEPRQIGDDALQSRAVAVERRETDVGEFQHMPALPARRRAGIEHGRARAQIEQGRCTLCRCVLHGNHALGEAGNVGYRTRTIEQHGLPDSAGADAICLKQREIVTGCGTTAIDA